MYITYWHNCCSHLNLTHLIFHELLYPNGEVPDSKPLSINIINMLLLLL